MVKPRGKDAAVITNMHARRLPVQARQVRRALDWLATEHDAVWPSDRYTSSRCPHWLTATSVSTGVDVSIHGLIAYSTVKWRGGVIA